MGPRRTTIALVLLALGLLVASAGAAFASSGDPWSPGHPATASGGADPVTGAGNDQGHDHESADGHDGGHGSGGWVNDGDVDPEPQPDPGTGADPGTGHDPGHVGNQNQNPNGPSAGGDTDGEVGGTSVDTPSAPVQAPAATAGGPAPAAVAPAPIVASALEAFTPVTGPAAGDLGAIAVPDATAVPIVAPMSFEGLPVLGSIGALSSDVPDGPSAARALISTPPGRSLAVLLALLSAIVMFLAIHRRVDRGDPKLASARIGPEVARFR